MALGPLNWGVSAVPGRAIISHGPPPVFQCLGCDLLFYDQCANCERIHSILKSGDDPIASKELARWIGGELREPEHGSDVLRDFFDTENIAHLNALLVAETHPDTNAKS
jgi:hypothetical protein